MQQQLRCTKKAKHKLHFKKSNAQYVLMLRTKYSLEQAKSTQNKQ